MGQTIYEAVNETLKELFVGSTPFPIEAIQAARRTLAPPAISHWRFLQEKIEYREIEHDLPDIDVKPFIEGYVRSIHKAGWKIIVE